VSVFQAVMMGLSQETKRTMARAGVAGLKSLAEDADRFTGIANLYVKAAAMKLDEIAKRVDEVPR
jgi:hypothetical protein